MMHEDETDPARPVSHLRNVRGLLQATMDEIRNGIHDPSETHVRALLEMSCSVLKGLITAFDSFAPPADDHENEGVAH